MADNDNNNWKIDNEDFMPPDNYDFVGIPLILGLAVSLLLTGCFIYHYFFETC